jgi:hypothetical protein
VTPVSVDRTTLFYGIYVPERDSMENADVWFAAIVAAAITVVLVALAVEATIAVKKGTHGCDLPVTAVDAKDKSHGCDLPVDFKEEEEDLSHLWEVGVCKHCRHTKEVYLPYGECSDCLWDDFFNPSPE